LRHVSGTRLGGGSREGSQYVVPQPEYPTRADLVDDLLTGAILRGELAPGERLTTAELADRFAVSATPLREAIQRLAGRGLVDLEPQKGARVAPASVVDAQEVFEARLLIEPHALEQSIRHTDDIHRGVIDRSFEWLSEVVESEGAALPSIAEAFHRFHMALLLRCPSTWLRHTNETLAVHAYRYISYLGPLAETNHDLLAGEREVLKAAHDGQGAEAAAALRRELRRSMRALIAALG